MAHLLRAARASSSSAAASLLLKRRGAAGAAPAMPQVAARALATGGASKPPASNADVEPKTSFNEILDRATNIFFLTELVRGLWLSFEVSMKPKVTIK
jgi:hypothetical protein